MAIKGHRYKKILLLKLILVILMNISSIVKFDFEIKTILYPQVKR